MRGATILAAGVQAAGAAVDEVPHRQHTVADLFSTAPVSFFVGNSTLGMKQPCDEAVIASGRAVSPCSDKAQRWIMAATILGSSMAFIDGTVVNVALAALQNSFGGTAVNLQWVVEAYGLFLSALILVGGSMGDLFGRRRMFLFGVSVFAIASAGCGLAQNMNELVVARAIQGLGAAFLVPGSLAIIGASFPQKERGRAIGTWSGFTAIMSAGGPIFGGWLIEHASWRWVFFINVPVAAIVIAISLWHVPESRSPDSKGVDWAGAVVATIGLAGMSYGFIESASFGWRHPFVWGAIAAGCLSPIAFFYIEARSAAPMVPLELFRSRTFTAANLLTLFLYAALGVFFFLFPLNLIQVQGYGPTATGAAALPLILLTFLLSRWSGQLVGRYGARRPLVIGPAVAAAGFILFAVPSFGGSYWRTFFPAFVVLGLGMAVSVAPLTTVVMSSVDQKRMGTASGINNTTARVAGLLSIAVLGLVMMSAFRSHLNRHLADLPIPTPAMRELQLNENRLAAMTIPAGLDANVAADIRFAVDQAFVFAFRLVMLTCAALCIAGATLAWRILGVLEETLIAGSGAVVQPTT